MSELNDDEPQQTIFEHGGSRIWIERDGKRELLADTYGDAALARAVMVCIRAYLQPNDETMSEAKPK